MVGEQKARYLALANVHPSGCPATRDAGLWQWRTDVLQMQASMPILELGMLAEGFNRQKAGQPKI
jgi:hypothetical protein